MLNHRFNPLPCVSRNTLLVLVLQLALTAEKSWRKIRGFKRLPEVIEGIRFQDGIAVITEPEKTEQTQQMAAWSESAIHQIWLFLQIVKEKFNTRLKKFSLFVLPRNALRALHGDEPLDHGNVFSLRAFLALRHLELYLLAFIQWFVAAWVIDLCKVHENIGAWCLLDKAEAFIRIKPFNGAGSKCRHDESYKY